MRRIRFVKIDDGLFFRDGPKAAVPPLYTGGLLLSDNEPTRAVKGLPITMLASLAYLSFFGSVIITDRYRSLAKQRQLASIGRTPVKKGSEHQSGSAVDVTVQIGGVNFNFADIDVRLISILAGLKYTAPGKVLVAPDHLHLSLHPARYPVLLGHPGSSVSQSSLTSWLQDCQVDIDQQQKIIKPLALAAAKWTKHFLSNYNYH
jgi:hypothetical protein